MARGYSKPETRPTKVPNDIDIAWSAGVYEGEGNIANSNAYACSRIMVSQKDPEILFKLRDWFGGSVKKNSGGKTKPEDIIHKWIACGERGRVFAALIYGFMSSRRRAQIDKTRILDFLEGRNPQGLSMSELQSIAFEFTEKRFKQTPHAIASRKYARNRNQAMGLVKSSYAPMERVM